MDELALRGNLAAAVGDVDGMRVQELDQALQTAGLAVDVAERRHTRCLWCL
ncbi:hypothetical protein [Streptomyces sp. NPDC093707]|uniref:hypothetical protein n=1 Tax=Streptomyces sp. NPDC093707 TaxID=3154984 RepID=UPI00344F3623